MSVVESPPPGALACSKCGEVHTRCSGHSRATGVPCKNWPIRGGRVCRKHGGNLQNVREAAERRLRSRAWRDALLELGEDQLQLGVPLDVDPAEALVEQVREAAGNVAYLRWRVQGLEDEELEVHHELDSGGWQHDQAETVKMYDRERDRLAKFAKLACDAGVQVRVVQALERDAGRLVAVLRHVLDGLELGAEQQARARALFREALDREALADREAAPGGRSPRPRVKSSGTPALEATWREGDEGPEAGTGREEVT